MEPLERYTTTLFLTVAMTHHLHTIVICSRGKFAYNSPGNCWFRTMVEEQMDNYAKAKTKTDKSLVVSILVNRVKQANGAHGGFVKNVGGRWYRVSERYSREKGTFQEFLQNANRLYEMTAYDCRPSSSTFHVTVHLTCTSLIFSICSKIF